MVKVTDKVRYLTADDEKSVIIAQANAPLTNERTFAEDEVLCRAGDGSGEAVLVAPGAVQYMDVPASDGVCGNRSNSLP